ncbi:MAG: hypothetical protein DU489_07135 [Nitrosomonas sp.]|uniref:hypothetical protein n=1 Tax=Nitrosomonas sp. TaxID=42353 RepID=UPI0032EE3B77
MFKHYRHTSDTQITRDILELYLKYGYLQSNFLYALMDGKVGKKYIVRKQYAMREKYGLLFRPREQYNCENSHYAFFIHGLTERGRELAKELGVNPPIIANITRRDPDETRGEFSETDVETKNFWHAMGIINTLASFEIGARQHGITFISEGEIRERFKQTNGRDVDFDVPFTTTYNGQIVTGKRKRDFLFGLTYRDGLSSFFVGENERDNPVDNPDLSRDGSSWLGKDIAYRDIIKKKTYQEHLGVPNLRVLVTTKSESKSNHQRELSKKIGETNYFLFKAIPDQKSTGKSPAPFPEILTDLWQRASNEPIAIYRKSQ